MRDNADRTAEIAALSESTVAGIVNVGWVLAKLERVHQFTKDAAEHGYWHQERVDILKVLDEAEIDAQRLSAMIREAARVAKNDL